MRKIQTAEEIEKKKKRNNLILAIIMILLIGISSLGYAVMSREDKTQSTNSAVYGGLQFVKSNTGYWATEINERTLYFNSLPSEIENVSITGNYSFENYYQQPVYIINSNPAVGILSYALENIALRVQEACIEGEKCLNAELPVKTCEDNLIVFKNANLNITKVTTNKKCVFIEGNFFEGADKLVYRMLNIA